jgi:hypothetical protein
LTLAQWSRGSQVSAHPYLARSPSTASTKSTQDTRHGLFLLRAHSSRFCCTQSYPSPYTLSSLCSPPAYPHCSTFLFLLPYSKAECAAAASSGRLLGDEHAASICKSAIRAPRRHACATLNCRKPAGVCPSSHTLHWLVLTFSFFRVSFSSVSGWTGPLLLRTLPAHDSTRQPQHHKSSQIVLPISTHPAGLDYSPAAAVFPCSVRGPNSISITNCLAITSHQPIPGSCGKPVHRIYRRLLHNHRLPFTASQESASFLSKKNVIAIFF